MKEKVYYVRPVGNGYGEMIDTGPLMTLPQAKKELTKVSLADAKEARQYFGTAVRHLYESGDYITITAGRDKRSALWCHWAIAQVY